MRTSIGTGPVKMLDAISAAPATAPVQNWDAAHSVIGLQVILAGGANFSGGTVSIYGSLDGGNTFDTNTALVAFTIGTDSNDAIKVATGKCFNAIQAVASGLTGGTNPTLTAWVAAY